MRRIITAAKMTWKVLVKVNPMKVIAMTKMGIKKDNITLLVLQGRIGTYNFVVPGLSEPLF